MQVEDLQRVLVEAVPLVSKFEIQVVKGDAAEVILAAPLGPNINHKNTAFAGSLNSVLTLSCWLYCFLQFQSEFPEGKIVLQSSQLDCHLPVTKNFAATCSNPGSQALERFLLMLRKRKKARLDLHSQILEDGKTAVSFTGRFVAFL